MNVFYKHSWETRKKQLNTIIRLEYATYLYHMIFNCEDEYSPVGTYDLGPIIFEYIDISLLFNLNLYIIT